MPVAGGVEGAGGGLGQQLGVLGLGQGVDVGEDKLGRGVELAEGLGGGVLHDAGHEEEAG